MNLRKQRWMIQRDAATGLNLEQSTSGRASIAADKGLGE